MKELLDYLRSIPPGPIEVTDKLEFLLGESWAEFRGASNESMSGRKLLGRMEDASWDPPILRFTIERHGAFVLGSSRADVHEWEVNIENKTAEIIGTTHRQLEPRQPRLDVQPLADRVVNSVLNHVDDDWLRWNKDGTVQVLIGKIIPKDSAVSATLQSRRKRIRTLVFTSLREHGWEMIRMNVYGQRIVDQKGY